MDAQAENEALLKRLLSNTALPSCFVGLVTACLAAVQDRLHGFNREKNDVGVAFLTDFDRYALQALAEALAELLWPERRAIDFDGPSLNVSLQRLRNRSRKEVLSAIFKNYLGSILQHYFSAARVRDQVRSLPTDTETNLRSVDASRIAEHVCRLVITDGGIVPISALELLDATIRKYLT